MDTEASQTQGAEGDGELAVRMRPGISFDCNCVSRMQLILVLF